MNQTLFNINQLTTKEMETKDWSAKLAQMIENHYNGKSNAAIINSLTKRELIQCVSYLKDYTKLRLIVENNEIKLTWI